MKILYHHRTASKDGQSTHIEEMIGGLKEHGCIVEVSAPSIGGNDAAGGSSGWVGKLKASLPRALYELAEIAYSWVAYRRLVKKITSFKPYGIYERYNLFLLSGIWAKRRFGLPLILEVNSPMALERRQYGGLSWPKVADWAERYVWKNADIILPVTQVLADYIVAQGVNPNRVVVIPNGINPRHYQDLPSTDEAKANLNLTGKLVIGFTGFVREWDRLDRIVRWIAAQKDKNLHLLVIGDGPARQEIERCAAESGVSDRLTFSGVVRREQVPALAMAFDIALQTALVPYASPLCLFEYLALSKAVVAPDQPNHHEILIDQIEAILYDPNDEQGIEKALSTLCTDASLRAHIASEGPKVIKRKGLTWNHHAARVLSLFASKVEQ
jgi:glycosyltransferase involved in cell wall biosynthesis